MHHKIKPCLVVNDFILSKFLTDKIYKQYLYQLAHNNRETNITIRCKRQKFTNITIRFKRDENIQIDMTKQAYTVPIYESKSINKTLDYLNNMLPDLYNGLSNYEDIYKINLQQIIIPNHEK